MQLRVITHGDSWQNVASPAIIRFGQADPEQGIAGGVGRRPESSLTTEYPTLIDVGPVLTVMSQHELPGKVDQSLRCGPFAREEPADFRKSIDGEARPVQPWDLMMVVNHGGPGAAGNVI